MKKKPKLTIGKAIIHIFFWLFSLSFVIPLILLLMISLSNEQDIYDYGYRLIPKKIDTTAYKILFENPESIFNAYKVTVLYSLIGTILSVLIMALIAYALSRKNYKLRKPLTFFIFFTMLFGGGLVPTYILITQYLHLGDSFWVYIFPTLASPFQIIIFRTFFQGLPESLFESAKLDGAHELTIFNRIVLPLSKPVLATISLMVILVKWNDWYTSLIYIRNPELISLQYMLQKILLEVEWLKNNYTKLPPGIDLSEIADLPSETTRMAICIIAAGPMLFVFPFFQKYFSKGLTVGAVKG